MGFPKRSTVEQVLAVLDAARGAVSVQVLETGVSLSRTRLELLLKILDVDGSVRRVPGGWVATGVEWSYDTDRYEHIAATRAAEQQAMLDYETTTRCRMRFLLEQLDDPNAKDCGRCDNCTGARRDSRIDSEAVRAATARLRRPGAAIEPKAQWPSALERIGIPLKGKIPPGERPASGRAVARFSDLSYGHQVRTVAAPEAPDGPIPPELLDAAVRVLGAWRSDWAKRPDAVIAVGSQARPELVASFASGVAEAGRLPFLGAVAHTGRSGAQRSNSAQRLGLIYGTFSLGDDIQARLGGELAGKAVLLLDDYVDSGWTLAVVARMLLAAGAGIVYPLALGIAG